MKMHHFVLGFTALGAVSGLVDMAMTPSNSHVGEPPMYKYYEGSTPVSASASGPCRPYVEESSGNAYVDKMISDTDYSSALYHNMQMADKGCDDAQSWLDSWSGAASTIIGSMAVQGEQERQTIESRRNQVERQYNDWYYNSRQNETDALRQGNSAEHKYWRGQRQEYQPYSIHRD